MFVKGPIAVYLDGRLLTESKLRYPIVHTNSFTMAARTTLLLGSWLNTFDCESTLQGQVGPCLLFGTAASAHEVSEIYFSTHGFAPVLGPCMSPGQVREYPRQDPSVVGGLEVEGFHYSFHYSFRLSSPRHLLKRPALSRAGEARASDAEHSMAWVQGGGRAKIVQFHGVVLTVVSTHAERNLLVRVEHGNHTRALQN